MFTQPKDPNNKNKPAYKNIVHIVTEQITPSHVILHSKFNSWLKKAGVMRMHPLLTLNVMKYLQKDFQKILKTLQTNDK